MRWPPPLFFVLAIVAGGLLHRFVVALPSGLDEQLSKVSGTAVLILGAVVMFLALGTLVRSGQNPEPWKATPELIFKGPYRFSRNPMYLGMALLQIGVGLRLANGWMLLLLPPALFAVYWFAIRHEEAYLEGKFGEPYRRYKSLVRRWL